MLLHNNPLFKIYFGTADDRLSKPVIVSEIDTQLQERAHTALLKTMRLTHLIFPLQTHGVEGHVITRAEKNNEAFSMSGDYLLTQEKAIGLGILTADCLPIVLYDAINGAVGIVHAGWRGSLGRIASKVALHMQKVFCTDISKLQVFLGPSAKSCCYLIKEDVLRSLEDFTCIDEVVHKASGRLFFDLPLFNCIQLQELGIPKDAFHIQYNSCTICDQRFCSYRRDGNNACRQMTVVCLR